MKTAEPEKLYHYTSAEQALELVSSGAIAWQQPTDLNGTTELNHNSELPFDQKSLTDSCVKMATNLIFGREAPSGDTPLIGAIKRWRESQRFATHEEAEQVLRDLLDKMVAQRFEELSGLVGEWRDFCDQCYMLSLFERPDNFLAWDKHAEAFRGAVFRFKVGDNTPFHGPQAIAYQNIRPEIASLKDQYAAIFYNMHAKTQNNFEEKFLCKAPPFKLEKEWRCFSKQNSSNVAMLQGVFTGLYLGPNIDNEQKLKIVEQCHKQFPKAKIAQMHFAKGKFDLSVEQI